MGVGVSEEPGMRSKRRENTWGGSPGKGKSSFRGKWRAQLWKSGSINLSICGAYPATASNVERQSAKSGVPAIHTVGLQVFLKEDLFSFIDVSVFFKYLQENSTLHVTSETAFCFCGPM